MRGYYFVTDRVLSRAGNTSDVRKANAAGVRVVQYREKNKDSFSMYEEARALKALCTKALFIVNDRVDIALAVKANGVHLGQDDLPCRVARKLLGKKKIIGVTVHTIRQAIEAERDGADYVAVSPIFATGTKQDAGRPVGLATLRKVKKRVAVPVVAIGGITFENAKDVIAAGADCLCAISQVVSKRDAGTQIRKFQRLFSGQKRTR